MPPADRPKIIQDTARRATELGTRQWQRSPSWGSAQQLPSGCYPASTAPAPPPPRPPRPCCAGPHRTLHCPAAPLCLIPGRRQRPAAAAAAVAPCPHLTASRRPAAVAGYLIAAAARLTAGPWGLACAPLRHLQGNTQRCSEFRDTKRRSTQVQRHDSRRAGLGGLRVHAQLLAGRLQLPAARHVQHHGAGTGGRGRCTTHRAQLMQSTGGSVVQHQQFITGPHSLLRAGLCDLAVRVHRGSCLQVQVG